MAKYERKEFHMSKRQAYGTGWGGVGAAVHASRGRSHKRGRRLSEQTAAEKVQFQKRMLGLARKGKSEGNAGLYAYAMRTIRTIRASR